jgi:GNAT superfamily N-acetyltransferase
MSSDPIEIRPATPADADAVSRVVVRSLRETDGKDYPPQVIEAVAARYTAKRVRELMASRRVLVAVRSGTLVGTASLEGDLVQSVYASPEQQGAGIGTSLMAAIEGLARSEGLKALNVASSITAEGFYRKLGFSEFGREGHGEERLIRLEKSLGGPEAD